MANLKFKHMKSRSPRHPRPVSVTVLKRVTQLMKKMTKPEKDLVARGVEFIKGIQDQEAWR